MVYHISQILISGLLCRFSLLRVGISPIAHLSPGGGGKIIARLVSLLWPLASFGLLFGGLLLLIGEIPFIKLLGWPFMRILYGGWFLTTLAILYLLHYVAMRFVKSSKWRVVVLGLIYGTIFFLPRTGVFWWTGNVVNMFPYFTFGHFVLKRFVVFRDWRIGLSCTIVFLSVVFLEGDIHTNGMAFYWTASDWRSLLWSNQVFACFAGRIVVGILGAISLLWVLNVLANKIPILRELSVFGTTTLGVYVLHECPLQLIHKYCGLDEVLPDFWHWPLAIAVFFICHCIIMIIRRNEPLKWFFFGNEKWLQGKIEYLGIKM